MQLDALYTPGLQYTPGSFQSGAGSPEGVIAAPVGTTYVDTAATTGAIMWVKTSGAGITGWQVVYGDTGWRNILPLLVNGWTATALQIRRINNVALLNYTALDGTAATNTAVLTIPSRFRPTLTLNVMVRPGVNTAVPVYGSLNASGILGLINGVAISANSDILSWVTDNPWPTVLP